MVMALSLTYSSMSNNDNTTDINRLFIVFVIRINVDKQQSHRSEETLETVLHGESLPHGVKLRDPNCKKGYRVFVCYEVLTKEERSRRVLCISKPYVVTSCICN
ncbi:unnamed protein product [Brassica rapa]|uniref:Uncharacterized protein n=1 Tax=Brassica campestris TaxID=3711 RepID=A0A8D9GEP3_BRACM|nr:unnamed protein product [Brassica rapa]